LARTVEKDFADEGTTAKHLRKATLSVMRYLLRATDRSTPFSLFAGVALCSEVNSDSWIDLDTEHLPFAAVDTAWVAAARKDLEQRTDVLRTINLQANHLLTRNGSLGGLPAPDGRTIWVKITGPMQRLLSEASSCVTYAHLSAVLQRAGGSQAQADRLIKSAIAETLLSTTLRAPMTTLDPLDHLVRQLWPHRAVLDAATVNDLDNLTAVQDLIAQHNRATPDVPRATLRDRAEERMARFDFSTRARLALHTRADATAYIPDVVTDEVAKAAHALMRLTRTPAGDSVWAHYQTMFWERYGPDILVPVREATDPGSGIGFPADYPLTTWQVRDGVVLDRDKQLAALAWRGLSSEDGEVVLSDRDINALAGVPADEQIPAPHVDLAVQIAAPSQAAVEVGEFALHVHPAWAAGVMTGRFAAITDQEALGATYRSLPTLVEGALAAQLVFTPVYPHAENVSRVPAMSPTVIDLDGAVPEDLGQDELDTIRLDDLALYSSKDGLRLVSLSRRTVVEPMTLHPLALEKQAPPIARFLAHVARSSATAWTEFDWGPALAEVPRLPRVRYGRTILSPARWRLSLSDLPTGPFTNTWHQALVGWSVDVRCPHQIGFQQEDRVLRVDLNEPAHARLLHTHLRKLGTISLVETLSDDDLAWIGHAHEIVYPVASTVLPARHPDLTHAPVYRSPESAPPNAWVQARVFTHPQLMDHLITQQIPRLLAMLEDRDSADVNARWWFIRYRSIEDEDHIRIRVATMAATQELAAVEETLAAWFDSLHRQHLAHRIVFDTYRPEIGRYGEGDALAAAEDLFEADSNLLLQILKHSTLEKSRACALSMLDLACTFLGAAQALPLLAAQSWPTPGDHALTADVTAEAATPFHPISDDAPDVIAAQRARAAALRRYRDSLTPGQDPADVLGSLLHMHHNRFFGPDRAGEAECRHAITQAARSLIAQGAT
jgi:thiopeptide-type bacteriocin biosynthesis protein